MQAVSPSIEGARLSMMDARMGGGIVSPKAVPATLTVLFPSQMASAGTQPEAATINARRMLQCPVTRSSKLSGLA